MDKPNSDKPRGLKYWKQNPAAFFEVELLDSLRRGSIYFDFHERGMRKWLADHGRTLTDIGTSEEELDRLRPIGHKAWEDLCAQVARGREESLA
ncbi:MAG: hypothetical protein HY226_06885 [Candidatus Vogelbacteria bacterium]|nr:hypothetical protein [Candidatus Vogelbacteria bacterium]